MNLKDLNLKRTYSSDKDNILFDFYIPILEKSSEYWRLAGFFSSSSLAIAARGIFGLVKNNGIMKVIASPKLEKRDIEIIMDAKLRPEIYIGNKFLEELKDIKNEFIKDHMSLLGWMVARGKLEIRIAISYDDKGLPLSYQEVLSSGIFHQKVGIFIDREDNVVTFSGSINETASGWMDNIEEFKVFRSWIPSEEEYVLADISKFKRFWDNLSEKIKVVEVPEAVKSKLIGIAPEDIHTFSKKSFFSVNEKVGRYKKIKLFSYQEEALKNWIKNNMRGIFEMATGTGKTFTALGCVEYIVDNYKKNMIFICCPYRHLIFQWENEIKKFDLNYDKLINPYKEKNWKNTLVNTLIDLDMGYISTGIVLITHRTLSSEEFIKIVKKYKRRINLLLIADEVHWLGARKGQKGLINEYNFRLGLSATPKRWLDDFGTEKIISYFSGVIYEFDLNRALSSINPITNETYLTHYCYIPKFVTLREEELDEFYEKTTKLVKLLNKEKDEENKKEIIEQILFARANIVKNAKNKFDKLNEILDELGKDVSHTLIYCTPQQIDKVVNILNERNLIIHRFTMREKTVPEKKYGGISEREFLLKKFDEGEYQILVAMKCLDEGVDVPPARTAILMASSGNPREYIQRIGRILRRHRDKKRAVIYDIIVIPSFYINMPPEYKELEKKYFTRN